ALLCEKVEKSLVLKSKEKVVIPNEEKIAEIEACVSDKTDFIVGVGSGVINDLCKYVSFKKGLYYGIVATAPSMDGYASVGSALILEGMKVTLNARPPKMIIGDTKVLSTAPAEMLQAGYGDIVGKFSCLNDWKLSALVNGEHICEAIYNLTLDTAKKIEPLGKSIMERRRDAIGELFEALVLVGVLMSFTGSSRPASGSEHHLSHFFEITGILEKKDYFAHGIDVVFSAVETARLRRDILTLLPERRAFDKERWEREIRRVYHSSADGVIALQNKLGFYEKEDAVVEKWEDVKKILSECPTPERFLEMTDSVGLDFACFEKLYGREKISDALLYSKDLKDRYTVLWLYYTYFRKV
ncbi:MAG: iron-containing alcohol dehydrogenase, partial [Clostridia bacterium]|nr:iron-containing alcohol dehydrogenase [Clostridia bacterium]